MSERERAIRQRLKDDYGHYAAKCLKIRTKRGDIEPFALNRAQAYLHERAESQLKRVGKVRLIILKGRQQGISTYVEGRLYWRTTHRRGVQAFILTHEQAATDNLFTMAQRYHDYCPEKVRPSTDTNSAKELYFGRLDSGYKVGTAGSKAVGRSSTIQYFHGSEVAFWPNADEHASGVMQAIPREAGTEVFLESTANGIGNYFHKKWQQAVAGGDEYEAVFIPWFWQPEYREAPAAQFSLDEDEAEYMENHGLDLEQMAWRRAKIAEFNGDVYRFQREYPATPDEAFENSSDDVFIPGPLVLAARKTKLEDRYGPRVIGVDVARYGDDRTAIAFRQGRTVHWVRAYEKHNTMEVTGIVKRAIDEIRPDAVFVDVVGIGAGVVDRLREMGYSELVRPVNGGEKPLDEAKYANRRAEMWGEAREWLKDKPAALPDDEALQADLCGLKYKYDSKGRYVLEKKEEAKARGIRSPDLADAVMLTFAEPVALIDHEDVDDYRDDDRSAVSGY